VRRVAVGAIVRDRLMLPEEWTALLRVARRASLVDRFLDEELGAVRAMCVVTAGTGYFPFQNRVPREAMNLSLLGLVAGRADVGLGQRVQHFLLDRMPFVAVRTRNAVRFVLAASPVRSRKDVCFMTVETGRISRCDRRQVFGLGSKHHLRRLAARIALVLGTFAVTPLATRSALIALHPMLGLVDGEDRLAPILIVANGAFLVAFQGSVDLCRCGERAEECRDAGTNQKKPNQFAHLFPSRGESGSLLITFRLEYSINSHRAILRIGQVQDTGIRRVAVSVVPSTSHQTGLQTSCT
jgi:hypothetical protein